VGNETEMRLDGRSSITDVAAGNPTIPGSSVEDHSRVSGRQHLSNGLVAVLVGLAVVARYKQVACAVHSDCRDESEEMTHRIGRQQRANGSVRRDSAYIRQIAFRNEEVARAVKGQALHV